MKALTTAIRHEIGKMIKIVHESNQKTIGAVLTHQFGPFFQWVNNKNIATTKLVSQVYCKNLIVVE